MLSIDMCGSSATLDQLRVDNQAEGSPHTIICTGRLKLQGCHVSARFGQALKSWGPANRADALGCTLFGGVCAVSFESGASGRVEGCDLGSFGQGCGLRVSGPEAGTFPLVSRNTIRDCKVGVTVHRDVDPAWSLGEDNTFANCAEGGLVDARVQGGVIQPGPEQFVGQGLALDAELWLPQPPEEDVELWLPLEL